MAVLRRWWLPLVIVGILCIPVLNYPKKAWSMTVGNRLAGYQPSHIDDQFHELLPYRLEFRRAVQWLRSTALATHETKIVYQGRDQTLFYRGEGGGDGHCLDDLRGEVPFSSAEINAIGAELERRQATMAAWGGRYFLVIVPNKEAVLTDLLPRRLAPLPGAVSRTDQVMKRAPAGMALDLRPALSSARTTFPDFPVYYRKDSHWTSWGAAVGCAAIRAHLDGAPTRIDPTGWQVTTTLPGTVEGDLATMLQRDGSTLVPTHEVTSVSPHVPPTPTFVSAYGHELTAGGLIIPWHWAYQRRSYENASASHSGSCVIVHDSFGGHEAITELTKEYATTELIWSHAFDVEELVARRPQVVIQVIVSRYLALLLPTR